MWPLSSSSSTPTQSGWSESGWSTPTPPPQPTPQPTTQQQNPISITDDQLPNETHNTYTITFFSTPIYTTVTHDPTTVTNWLSSLPQTPKTIGLDTEWRPNFSNNIQNPTATLQLCVGNCCLIFQLIHAPFVPKALITFLDDSSNVFVGVGIKADLEKLQEDWEFGFRANVLDLRGVVAERFGDGKLKNSGLKELARVVLGRDVPKPKRVTMSRWDYQWLRTDQVMYATVDAFVCSEIARLLNENDANAIA